MRHLEEIIAPDANAKKKKNTKKSIKIKLLGSVPLRLRPSATLHPIALIKI
jgi:hypothetical protein